jgi:Tol biopolymer transport system component
VLNGTDIWVVDLERSIPTLFAATSSREASLAWSPDGHRIAFVSNRTGRAEIYVGEIGGTGEPQMLPTTNAQFKTVYDWSGDGRYLLFGELNASTGWDTWLLPVAGDGKPEPLITGPTAEINATLSPDGKWLAYMSSESGQPEIYVRSFPQPGRKVRVSTDLGVLPNWSRGGRELLYFSGSNWMVVDIPAGEEFRPGTPTVLFALPGDAGRNDPGTWAKDGERFLVSIEAEEVHPEIRVLLNWTRLLER